MATAQNRPKEAPAPQPLPPIFAPRPSPKDARPGRGSTPPPQPTPTRRAISPEMAEKIAGVAARAAASIAPLASSVVAAPPNEIDGTDAVQLAPFIVQEDKLPTLREWNLLTPKQKLERAHKLNPGLKPGGLPLLNDALALELMDDVMAQERRKELANLKSVLGAGGEKAPPELKRKIDEAMMRKNEWSHEAGTPFRTPR